MGIVLPYSSRIFTNDVILKQPQAAMTSYSSSIFSNVVILKQNIHNDVILKQHKQQWRHTQAVYSAMLSYSSRIFSTVVILKQNIQQCCHTQAEYSAMTSYSSRYIQQCFRTPTEYSAQDYCRTMSKGGLLAMSYGTLVHAPGWKFKLMVSRIMSFCTLNYCINQTLSRWYPNRGSEQYGDDPSTQHLAQDGEVALVNISN